MRIKTKVNVDYNQGVAGTVSGKVIGLIHSAGWVNNAQTNKFDQIGVNFSYITNEGIEFFKDALVIRGEVVIDDLYDAIKSQVPTDEGKAETEQTVFYLAFIQSMATTFDIEPKDIEIID